MDYYGSRHTGYLHARGRGATNTLLSLISRKENLNIVEIGFGTGATLVKLASGNNQLKLSGVEISEEMFKIAKTRLKFCLLKNKVDLKLTDDTLHLPFLSESVDVVYAESVLGIFENNQLPIMISEIYRTLKPGGRLILNETIWLETVPFQKIRELNQLSRKAYGIIQASESYPYISNWKALFLKNKFSLEKFEPIISTDSTKQFNLHLILSDCFSMIGKLKSNLNAEFRREKKIYSNKMNELKFTEKQMEGYLIVVRK